MDTKKGDPNYNAFNRKRLKYFAYEEEFYCNDLFEDEHRDFDKIQGIYLLIGGLLLLASICIIGFDLFLNTPEEGLTAVDHEEHDTSQEQRRHYNTPVSTISSSPPVLSPMEYWI